MCKFHKLAIYSFPVTFVVSLRISSLMDAVPFWENHDTYVVLLVVTQANYADIPFLVGKSLSYPM